MLRHLRHLEKALGKATSRCKALVPAPGLRQRALRQAVREALLAACPDWPAERDGQAIFARHVVHCLSLTNALLGNAALDPVFVAALEEESAALFEDVDPFLFAGT